MNLLTLEFYILIIILSTVANRLFKVKIPRFLIFTVLIISLPIYLGYNYAFNNSIYNIIIITLSSILLAVFFFSILKKINNAINFVILILSILFFSLLIISKKELNLVYKETISKHHLTENYFKEKVKVHSFYTSYNFKYPIYYEYFIFKIYKKELYIKKRFYDNNGNIYFILNNGKVLLLTEKYEYKILNELPDDKLNYTKPPNQD
jgi:hypothetical protein